MLPRVGGLIWVPLWAQSESGESIPQGAELGGVSQGCPGRGGTESPLWGWGPLPTPGVQLKVPLQVAGTWYSLAMAASDISLLDAQSAPLRVYVEELKPTPEGDLEILLQKRWVSPHSTWNSPSPGGCGVCETRAQGMGGTRLRGPRPLGAWPRAMGQKGHHTEWPWGWCGERPVCRMLGIRAWAAAARSPVCPREVGQRLEEF